VEVPLEDKDNNYVKDSKYKTQFQYFMKKNEENCNKENVDYKTIFDFCVKEKEIYASMDVDQQLIFLKQILDSK